MYNQKAMKELKELLIKTYPDYIDKVILFGSRITEKENNSSDYDILVILKKLFDWRFKYKIYDISYDIDLKYDIITDVKLISKIELRTIKGKQPFILDALEKGIVI